MGEKFPVFQITKKNNSSLTGLAGTLTSPPWPDDSLHYANRVRRRQYYRTAFSIKTPIQDLTRARIFVAARSEREPTIHARPP